MSSQAKQYWADLDAPSKQLQYINDRKRRGVCVACGRGKPTPGKWKYLCVGCGIKQRERMRRFNNCRAKRKGGPGRPLIRC